VHVAGTVFEAGTTRAVGGGEVVFTGPNGETTATADAAGRYEIDVVPGLYRPFVRGQGHVSVAPRRPERVPGPPRAQSVGESHHELGPLVVITGDESGVDLLVQTSGLLTGRVSNRRGEPVAHAIVRARGGDRPLSGTDIAETDDEGTFTLELPVGGYRLDASHADYAGLDGSRTYVEIDADLRPGSVDLTLVAGCVIRGHVLGGNGVPTSDGSIEHRTEGMDAFRPSGPIEADGSFRWTTTMEGEVTLRAWPWKAAPSNAETFHCTDGARHEATLLMPDVSADLDGKIAKADGSPAAGAFIDIYAITPGGMNQQERADADGEWAVYSLPAGEYMVTATVDGEGSLQRRITVPAHEVKLALSGTGTITGTINGVRDGAVNMAVSGCMSGDSVPYAQGIIRLVPVHGGRFQIDRVQACRVTVLARAGGETARAEVAVTANRVATTSFDLSPRRDLDVPTPVAAPERHEPPPEPVEDQPVAEATPPIDEGDAADDDGADEDEVTAID
jgi:hypothetical protein